MEAFRGKRRTWCRVCGLELRLPVWKSLIGLNVAYCPDQEACQTRFRAKRAPAGPPIIAAEQEPEHHGSWLRLLHRTSA
jgi:hypothetical protein